MTTLFSVGRFFMIQTALVTNAIYLLVRLYVVRTLSQKWDQSLFVVEFLLRYFPTRFHEKISREKPKLSENIL